MALIELIEEDVIKVPLAATTKDGVIQELVDVLLAAGKISDKNAVYKALLERESKGSTGLAEGIAVPHAKTAAVKGLTIAIGIAPKGIDFAALDDQPSNIFFLILAPPDQSGPHIEALAEIARLSRSKAFLRSLAQARKASEVVELFRD
jgi:nitrogen PTS system EIIA component